MSLTRRLALAAAAALALTACNQSGGGGDAAAQPQGRFERPGDMAIGSATAPVTLIEYASVTCPACARFHAEVYPTLKAQFIDTGKVRYVFREFPTAPAQVAAAGFQVARCGGASPEQYFDRLGVMFEQQNQVLNAAQRGQARQALLDIARSAGLSEQQFDQCVRDPAAAQRIQATVEHGVETFDISGTPTLIINDEKLNDARFYSAEGLAAELTRRTGGN